MYGEDSDDFDSDNYSSGSDVLIRLLHLCQYSLEYLQPRLVYLSDFFLFGLGEVIIGFLERGYRSLEFLLHLSYEAFLFHDHLSNFEFGEFEQLIDLVGFFRCTLLTTGGRTGHLDGFGVGLEGL